MWVSLIALPYDVYTNRCIPQQMEFSVGRVLKNEKVNYKLFTDCNHFKNTHCLVAAKKVARIYDFFIKHTAKTTKKY